MASPAISTTGVNMAGTRERNQGAPAVSLSKNLYGVRKIVRSGEMANLTSSPRKLSLRERNKLATRDAIADAATRLAMQHGIPAVRVEDIAADAGVSLRTFSNYFSNKYEALICRHVERMHHAAIALRSRPTDEPLWDAITAAIMAPWASSEAGTDVPSAATLAELRLLYGNSSVQGEILKSALSEDNDFVQAISERTNGTDFYCRLLAAATTMVTQVALDMFLKAVPRSPLKPMLAESLAQLAKGFPNPGKMRVAKRSASKKRTKVK